MKEDKNIAVQPTEKASIAITEGSLPSRKSDKSDVVEIANKLYPFTTEKVMPQTARMYNEIAIQKRKAYIKGVTDQEKLMQDNKKPTPLPEAQPLEEVKTAEGINAQIFLDKKDLHWTYQANGNGRLLHDVDCKFCDVKDRVLDAMQEYAEAYHAQFATDAGGWEDYRWFIETSFNGYTPIKMALQELSDGTINESECTEVIANAYIYSTK